jgi:hypothetical protein
LRRASFCAFRVNAGFLVALIVGIVARTTGTKADCADCAASRASEVLPDSQWLSDGRTPFARGDTDCPRSADRRANAQMRPRGHLVGRNASRRARFVRRSASNGRRQVDARLTPRLTPRRLTNTPVMHSHNGRASAAAADRTNPPPVSLHF